MKEELHCGLIAMLEGEGPGGRWPVTAGVLDGGRLTRGRRLGMTLISGPHLSASCEKEKKKGWRLGRGEEELGRWAASTHVGEKRPAARGDSRARRKRKEEVGQLEWAAREERGEGRKVWVFLFKSFSNSFFKLSNFNKNRNHAFES
jgi:hypothetical protein